MAIQASEIKSYKAAVNDDSASNGGRMSAVEAVTGVNNNVWPYVSQAERVAGSTKWRKLFHKVANAANLTLFNARVIPAYPTEAGDAVYVALATQVDVQDDIADPDLYGAGDLNDDVIATAVTCDVAVEDGAVTIFRDGDLVAITDKASPDGAGNLEYVTIDQAPSVNGDIVTIHFTPALANGYSAASTRVASVIEAGDIATAISGVTVTSAAGTFDDATYPIAGDNRGTVRQAWTLTFTSATAFDAVGDTVGSVGSGNITSDFAPVNADFSQPYFSLDHLAWGGTYQAGDTLEFVTDPAAIPTWEKRVVPAATDSKAGNFFEVWIGGESA